MISKHLHWSEENYRRMHMLIDSADAHDKLSARWSGCTATTVVHHHQTGRLSIAHVPCFGWVLVISPLVQLWYSMHFLKGSIIHLPIYYIYMSADAFIRSGSGWKTHTRSRPQSRRCQGNDPLDPWSRPFCTTAKMNINYWIEAVFMTPLPNQRKTILWNG